MVTKTRRIINLIKEKVACGKFRRERKKLESTKKARKKTSKKLDKLFKKPERVAGTIDIILS